jgi:hypothetical protein
LIAGTVDPVTSTAEIRTYEHVSLLHHSRFQKPIEINADEYAEFLQKTEVVMELARVKSTHVGPSLDLLTKRKPKQRIFMPMLLFLVTVIVLAAIVVYRVSIMPKH